MKKAARTTRSLAMAILASAALLLGGCAASETAAPGTAGTPGTAAAIIKGSAPPAKAAPGYKYVCGCGVECTCGTNCDKPGTCTCGRPLVYKKILRDYPNTFGVCPDPGCALEEVARDNPNKCACGKDLQVFPKKGKYSCACSGCDCNCTSRNPGKCSCGKEMVE